MMVGSLHSFCVCSGLAGVGVEWAYESESERSSKACGSLRYLQRFLGLRVDTGPAEWRADGLVAGAIHGQLGGAFVCSHWMLALLFLLILFTILFAAGNLSRSNQ